MSLFSNESPKLNDNTFIGDNKAQNVAHVILNLTSASTVNLNVFMAGAAYKVTSVREVHGTAGGTLAAFNLEIIPSGTANGSGTQGALTAALVLTGTANTPQTGTLGNITAVTIPVGSRLGYNLTGTLTGLANCQVIITLARV